MMRRHWCHPAAALSSMSSAIFSFGSRPEMEKRKLSAPILLELVKHALDAIVDEMAIALVRTAYSNNLKNSMDMSCALCDAQGRLIAQGMTLPLHLGSIPDAMGCITRKLPGAWSRSRSPLTVPRSVIGSTTTNCGRHD